MKRWVLAVGVWILMAALAGAAAEPVLDAQAKAVACWEAYIAGEDRWYGAELWALDAVSAYCETPDWAALARARAAAVAARRGTRQSSRGATSTT